LLQAAAAVQDLMQVVAQVAGSLRLQATPTEVTQVVLEVRSQLVVPLARVVVERRMQAVVAAASGVAVAALHMQAAAVVLRSRAPVYTESLTRLPLG
jgi:hypothetical protein